MATFPSYGRLLFENFSRDRASGLRRTQMESGPPKQLVTRSRTMVEMPVIYQLGSLADYNSFLTWFNTTINLGADWFDWTDPVDSVVKQARIKEGKISEVPQRKQLDRWKIAFTLEFWGS